MASTPSRPGRPRTHRDHDPRAVITDARQSASDDLARRQKRYFIAMTARVLCVPAVIFVGGWLRWALIVAAVILPSVAVAIANQADRRSPATIPPTSPGEPSDARQLTIGASDIIRGQVDDIEGETDDVPHRAA